MKALRVFVLFLLVSPLLAAQAPSGFTKINTTPVTTTTYSDSGCADLTTCYYFVTAVMSGGQESAGAPCSTTTLCYNGNQAVAIMPSSGTHTVALSWTASSSSGATYNVYRMTPSAPSSLSATVN